MLINCFINDTVDYIIISKAKMKYSIADSIHYFLSKDLSQISFLGRLTMLIIISSIVLVMAEIWRGAWGLMSDG